MIKLSIIIPAYNAEPYLGELVECLSNQIIEGTPISSKTVEVIIIDDGSKKKVEYSAIWLKVFRQKNKGAGAARNFGIVKASGKYLSFVDADDLVAPDYISQIFKKMDEVDFDICEMSWKSLTNEGTQFNRKLKDKNDRLKNCSSCMRIFKRDFIGAERFSELKDATQDEDFSRRLGYLDPDKNMVITNITDYMYFYRTAVEDSQSKKFKEGLRKTKRVVYYYNHVTKDMTWLIDLIRKDDELNEVWLLTNRCDIPELKRWCQIHTPIHIWTHYLKGEPYSNVTMIPFPYKTQIVLYIHKNHIIGGIETFIYEFCRNMSKFYDITYVVDDAPKEHIRQMQKVVHVIAGQPKQPIECDTLIMLRILDSIPANITYKKSIQMCHACRTNDRWHIPQQCDYIVNVSQTSKDSFGKEAENGKVIHNIISKNDKKPLLLVSACRIPAPDKGNNEKRMMKLADMLNKAGIPFLWLNFSEGQLPDAPKGFYNMGLMMNISDYFGVADYVVQLSDSEAWSYTVLEALTQNVPVLVTPFPSALEMGIEDGKNGYILPFDMDFDVKKILDVPKFEYEYDYDGIIKQWKSLIKAKPKNRKKVEAAPAKLDESCIGHEAGMVKVKVICRYKDMEIGYKVNPGTILTVTPERAKKLINQNLCKMMGG